MTCEKAPVYTLGSPDARAYSRNKRGIAGSLIWINFDRHALLNLIQQCAGTFVADIDEIRPQYTQVAAGGQVFSSSVVRSVGPSIGSTINNVDALTITSAGQQKQVASPRNGLVFDTLYRQGEWVAAGNPIVQLLPPEDVEVRFFVPEPVIGGLKVEYVRDAYSTSLAAEVKP